MELKRAKEVLDDLLLKDFSENILYRSRMPEIIARAESETAIVNGSLTADELEAIATWMRDPEGLTKA